MVGQDSFVVAHAPHNETWTKQELDFVKVVLNEDLKLYMINGGSTGGGGFGVHPGVSVGTGLGGGGYGGGMGGGLGISLGGGGGRNGGSNKVTYYYGANTAEMSQLTVDNFNDIMSEIMGDEPLAVEAIRSGKFTVGNINGLIAYFKKLKASHQGGR